MFDRLKSGIKNNIEQIIAECVAHKAKIVGADEFDRGCRQLLNLGHTVGHAIEICSDLTISHGSAVAIGTVVVTKIAVALGICSADDLDEIVALLESEGLPTKCNFAAKELALAASADKKRSSDSLTLILPYGIGNCKTFNISVNELENYIQKGL